MHITFWSENLKGKDNSEELDVEGTIMLEWILGIQGRNMWTEFIWLWVGTSGGLL
jgi:hypothetical protein